LKSTQISAQISWKSHGLYLFYIYTATKYALLNKIQVNVPSGKTLTFAQARTKSQKVASALARMGFKKGDAMFFVTSEFVDIYLIQLAVWLLGGAVRGTSTVESQGTNIFTKLKPNVRKLFQKVMLFK
jgi:acyl-coenzyme A synthetase/AMP-(fatty) acid ligase